ncbi:MAG: hypothetical protein LBT05_06670 [Planctomycetaceae bacterium]|nr:hypothetical protein [Planctomycetaceae bacterium]
MKRSETYGCETPYLFQAALAAALSAGFYYVAPWRDLIIFARRFRRLYRRLRMIPPLRGYSKDFVQT